VALIPILHDLAGDLAREGPALLTIIYNFQMICSPSVAYYILVDDLLSLF